MISIVFRYKIIRRWNLKHNETSLAKVHLKKKKNNFLKYQNSKLGKLLV